MAAEDFNILMGKRVKLTLKTASYFGFVQRINPNKSMTLTDVVDVKSGRRFPGVKLFFGHEIVNVEFCGETNSNNGERCTTEREGILNVKQFQPYKNNIICDNDDDDDDEYVNFQVIDEFNEKFGPAVMHIKKQNVVGVAADGVESFQHGRLCWLQIATKNRVYLFDILLLGAQAFKNGLSMILQCPRLLKVMHDCRGVASSLLAQFGVNLTNVFDTQVADVMCFQSDTGGYLPDRVSTLPEVVSMYLKVPFSRLSSLQMKTELTKEEREMWFARPCPLPLLKVMALSVIHLQSLRLVQLDAMMKEYVDRVASYLSSSHAEPGAVQHIAMSNVLELPRELKELEHIRKDRQRHALDRFNVTEHGLLDRFNPRSKTPPKATPQSLTLPIGLPPSQTSRPQPTRGSCLQSNALTPAGLAASPPPTVLGPAPPPAAAPRPSLSSSNPGMRELMWGIFGRGRPLSEAPQAPLGALPSFGRGFVFQKASASSPVRKDGLLPWASMDNQTSPRAMPRLAGDTVAPRDLSAAGVPQGYIPGLGRGQLKPSVDPQLF